MASSPTCLPIAENQEAIILAADRGSGARLQDRPRRSRPGASLGRVQGLTEQDRVEDLTSRSLDHRVLEGTVHLAGNVAKWPERARRGEVIASTPQNSSVAHMILREPLHEAGLADTGLTPDKDDRTRPALSISERTIQDFEVDFALKKVHVQIVLC